MSTHLVLFYTEGPGFDNGLDLRMQAQDLTIKSEQYFKTIIKYCPRDLIQKDKSWVQIFEDKREWVEKELSKKAINLKWNQNWAALNFLLWKPVLIDYIINTDDRIQEGDIVFYHDIDTARYPEYLRKIEKWNIYIQKKMKKKSILLFNDNNMKMYQDTKYELLEKYFYCVGNYEKLHHIWAGAFAIKKNDYGREFLREWVKICSVTENVSPITNYSNYPGYIWHSQEQACLSVLYHVRKINTQIICIFLWGKRVIPASKISIIRWPLVLIKSYLNLK